MWLWCLEFFGGTPELFPGGTQSWASPRRHHFEACPVAQVVVDHLALAYGTCVSCDDVWLVQAPKNMQQCVWDEVVLAAVSATESVGLFL